MLLKEPAYKKLLAAGQLTADDRACLTSKVCVTFALVLNWTRLVGGEGVPSSAGAASILGLLPRMPHGESSPEAGRLRRILTGDGWMSAQRQESSITTKH